MSTYQQHLIEWAAKESGSTRNNWPGFPIINMPFSKRAELQELIDAGTLRLVKREGKSPTGVVRTVTYVAPGE